MGNVCYCFPKRSSLFILMTAMNVGLLFITAWPTKHTGYFVRFHQIGEFVNDLSGFPRTTLRFNGEPMIAQRMC